MEDPENFEVFGESIDKCTKKGIGGSSSQIATAGPLPRSAGGPAVSCLKNVGAAFQLSKRFVRLAMQDASHRSMSSCKQCDVDRPS